MQDVREAGLRLRRSHDLARVFVDSLPDSTDPIGEMGMSGLLQETQNRGKNGRISPLQPDYCGLRTPDFSRSSSPKLSRGRVNVPTSTV